MKKLLSMLLALAMLLSMAGAALGEEEVTLDFWVRFDDDLSEEIANFEAMHPGVKINQVQVGANYDDLVAKYNAAMQAGDMPEIGMVGQRHGIPQFYDAGWLIPMENYMTAEEQADIPDGYWVRYTYDGKRLAVPFGCSMPIMAVNMTLLRELGYDTVPTTWDGIVEAAYKAVKDVDGDGATDIYGINFNSDTPWYIQPLLWCAGGSLFDGEGNPHVNTPEMKLVLSRLAQLVKDGVMPANQHKTGSQDFQNGGTLFYFVSCAFVEKAVRNVGDAFEVGVGMFPTDKTLNVCIGGNGLAIFKSDERKQEIAAEFIKYMISPEVSINTSLMLGYIPYTYSQFELDYIKEKMQDPRLATVLEQTKYIKGEGVSPVDAVIWNTMLSLISELEADPDMDLDKALEDFQAEVDEYMMLY